MSSPTIPTPHPTLNRLDQRIAKWMRDNATVMCRISLAVVFIWFGALKIAGNSPAIELVTKTVYWFDPKWFVPVLGWWEVFIGLCMLWRPLIRASIALLALQMPGTFLPLVLLPGVCFAKVPWVPTLEGQYIIKNLVLIAAAMAVGGTVRTSNSPSSLKDTMRTANSPSSPKGSKKVAGG